MKVPRDIDAIKLIKLLQQYGYRIIKQTGSHIRMSKNLSSNETHNITIPNHKPIKIGTLHSISSDICEKNKLNKKNFYAALLLM